MLITHIIKIYINLVCAIWKVRGISVFLFIIIVLYPLFFVFTFSTLLLDYIFFPQFKKMEIKNPLFIVGSPRSGTTFLHQSLNQTREFCAFEFWHLIFPSLTARKLIAPVIKHFVKEKKSLTRKASGHVMYIDSIEEEDNLFLHVFATIFPIGYLISPYNKEVMNVLFYFDDFGSRKQVIRFFKNCLKRQIYYLGNDRVIAKMPTSTLRLRTFLEEFPDAKIIYLLRDPIETIPSTISHVSRLYDFWIGLEAKKRGAKISKLMKYVLEDHYIRYLDYYKYPFKLIEENIVHEENCHIVEFIELMNDTMVVFDQVKLFSCLTFSDDLNRYLEDKYSKKVRKKREHENVTFKELKEFGISENRIKKDLRFLYSETTGEFLGKTVYLEAMKKVE